MPVEKMNRRDLFRGMLMLAAAGALLPKTLLGKTLREPRAGEPQGLTGSSFDAFNFDNDPCIEFPCATRVTEMWRRERDGTCSHSYRIEDGPWVALGRESDGLAKGIDAQYRNPHSMHRLWTYPGKATSPEANETSPRPETESASADRWKAEQRDWLLAQLYALRDSWLAESEKKEPYFCPDPDADRVAKGRTAGCARELNVLLEKLL